MTIRVLTYLEPCIFRDDPGFLRGHFDYLVNPMLRALSLDSPLGFLGIASNIFLCLEGLNSARALPANPQEVKLYPLYNADLLAQRNFCIEDYARDVFDAGESAFDNPGLLQRLSLIIEDAQPDVIITTSQNRYLNYLSRTLTIPVFSTEFGPLPRLPYPGNRFVAVDGHFSGGAFASPSRLHVALKSVGEADVSQSIHEFEANYSRTIELHPQYEMVRRLVESIKGGGTVSMLALQPEQWLTWEGALGKRRAGVSIIYEALARMRTDKLIVTFHNDRRGQINPTSLREIWLSDPRFALLPDELSFGLSELYLPFVDELITVSSNLAMSAFLLGKTVTAIGDSFARTLEQLQIDSNEVEHTGLREGVLRYLTDRMCVEDATFSDPLLLRRRLNYILSKQQPTAVALLHALARSKDDPTPQLISYPHQDLRSSELTVIHSIIADHLSGVEGPNILLLSLFGRHALGYLLSEGAVGAEFGVARGYFSESLLRSRRFARLYSIDRWSDHHNEEEFSFVRDRLAPFGEYSQIIRMSFEDALAEIPDKSLDFVYVDGYAHTGHDAEIVRQSLSKLKPGGLVAVHDYDRFSWPINYRSLTELFSSGAFTELQTIPAVLTINSEDIFPGLVARYCG